MHSLDMLFEMRIGTKFVGTLTAIKVFLMNNIGVLIEKGLLRCGIVTNLTIKVLCILFSRHFDFVKINVSSNVHKMQKMFTFGKDAST
jgi:hypothetical protein